jgi:hypothetical protein
MNEVRTATSMLADDVARTARRVGLDLLQEYVDELTGTREYGWFETRTATADERRQLAELIGEENLGDEAHPLTELTYRQVNARAGEDLIAHLAAINLPVLVRTTPFARWYRNQLLRLQRDADLLGDRARQLDHVARAGIRRAQAAYVAAEADVGNEELSDWQRAMLRSARERTYGLLYSRANDRRGTARWASREAAKMRSTAELLSKVKSKELAALGAALEAFVCYEFSSDLSAVDSVHMLFMAWVDQESTPCASTNCSQRFISTGERRRRPQAYCSAACRTAAYRVRERSAHAA